MKQIVSRWNIFRLVRLLIGTGAAAQGFVQKESLLVVVGLVLLVGAVLNVGCCGSAGCPVPSSPNKTNKEVEYEELDSEK